VWRRVLCAHQRVWDREDDKEGDNKEIASAKVDSAAGLTEDKQRLAKMKATPGATLMQTEERNTGAIE